MQKRKTGGAQCGFGGWDMAISCLWRLSQEPAPFLTQLLPFPCRARHLLRLQRQEVQPGGELAPLPGAPGADVLHPLQLLRGTSRGCRGLCCTAAARLLHGCSCAGASRSVLPSHVAFPVPQWCWIHLFPLEKAVPRGCWVDLVRELLLTLGRSFGYFQGAWKRCRVIF